jgi:hypothetical protein
MPQPRGMKTFSVSFLALAGVVGAGCQASGSRIAPRIHTPIWQDTGTPPATIAERAMRYYRDETGAVWDDRGRKLEAGS